VVREAIVEADSPLLLIVDDDVDQCRNLADILGDLGYQTDIAHDGPSALQLVRKRPYRVAVLDYRMPGMDGLTLCREIGRLSAGTVSIIVTAYAGGINAEQFLDAGVRMVLPKPVEVRQLVESLQQLLGPARQV
jgi:two-component system, NtrC family, response regulator HydG